MHGARAVGVALALLAADARGAEPPVPAEWPAIDTLVAIDLLTPIKLEQPIVIDLKTGSGADRCPAQAWTGQAIFLSPGGEELVYWGTGIYCAPIGYGRVQYSDGRAYVGQVNSFLASASATLTQAQFRPAVRHGNGKLERPNAAPEVGRFQRGALADDRGGDPRFLAALDAAESSLPDRLAPMMTAAVAAFAALPGAPGGAPPPAAEGVPGPAAAAAKASIGDSVAAVGAAAAEAMVAAPTAPAAADASGGSLFAAAAGATSGAAAGVAMAPPGGGSGALALPAPVPPDYFDMAGMLGFAQPDEAAVAGAKQLTKEIELKTKGNGIFYGAACPKAGFLGLKPWRARVVFTQTASGRIVYDGIGLGCGPIGPGRIEFEDGSVYEGQVSTFTNSQMNPVGNFEPAVPSGPGRFTFPDGTVVEGTWARGELNGGPLTVTRPGGQPQAFASGTLAGLRGAGGAGATAPALASIGGAVGAEAVAAAAFAPAGTAPGVPGATPFAPAGSTPFAPAGAVGAGGGEPGKAGPQPMLGNTGKYLCPYTEDGVVAAWVDKAIKARMGGAIGGMVGAEAGKKLFENIPMFGGMLGKAAGDKMGREVAIKMAGGWEYIKANSDQSFDNVNDYVAWLKANYKGTQHYNDVVAAIKELYPELKTMQF